MRQVAAPSNRFAAEDAKFGLHRVYFDKEKFKNLSFVDAQKIYEKLELKYKSYLEEIRVPRNVIDKLLSYSSDNAWLVSGKDMKKYLPRYNPALEELLIARCNILTLSERQDYDKIFRAINYTVPLKDGIAINSGDCESDSSRIDALGFSNGYCNYLLSSVEKEQICEKEISDNATKSFWEDLDIIN